ncbi:MAG: gfo/Idh/MocA family oxidoreductase, partial [Bacteroidales bacterium]|nr:gfo/Idh/MocA family oxidoreductase [Bacteroidales bacterium]
IVKLTYPERENLPKLALPEVVIRWYDGGLVPERPEGLPAGTNLNIQGGAAIFYGEKGIIVSGTYGAKPYMIKDGKVTELKEGVYPDAWRKVTTNHQQDWIRACKEDPATRVPSASDFSEAGPFNEMVVMGAVAVRLQGLNQELEWDGANMRFTNIGNDENIKFKVKDGFAVHDGHPTFQNKYTDDINAQAFAAELIKHTYREGYSLPDMPIL